MELQVSEAIIEAPTQTAQKKKSEFRVSEAKLHCECKKKLFFSPELGGAQVTGPNGPRL